MSGVVFVDTETTGLDPDRHEIWEVAIGEQSYGHLYVRSWFLPVDLTCADPIALDIGRFHDRHPQGNNTEWDRTTELFVHGGRGHFMNDVFRGVDDFVREFASRTAGKHLVGAVPSFDEERLRKLCLAHGVRPSWHYHLVDVEALAVGYVMGRSDADVVGLTLPWKSEDLSRAVGVEPDDFDRHTARGDVEWAAAIYLKVMERSQELME